MSNLVTVIDEVRLLEEGNYLVNLKTTLPPKAVAHLFRLVRDGTLNVTIQDEPELVTA